MNGLKAPDFSVAGQHVLVSGGGGGIGTAFSRAFRDSGAIVTITDIKSPANDEGFRCEQLDVRDDAAVEALAAKIDTLHVLIHCAGRLIRHEEHKPEVFRDIIDIHLVGNLRLATAFRPHLAKTQGCLINIGSMYSYFGAAMIPGYAAAKTGIVGLTKSLALAYAEDGIRVNAVAPGFFASEMTSELGADADSFPDWLTTQTPLRRGGRPGELDDSILFLLGEQSSFVTGHVLTVDGGLAVR